MAPQVGEPAHGTASFKPGNSSLAVAPLDSPERSRGVLCAARLVADMLIAENELTIHGIRISDHGQI